MEKKYLSTMEAAQKMGISRQAVLKKIQSGEISAVKIGRGYIVAEEELPSILSQVVTQKQKQDIDKSVDKTLKEYGETLKLLGKE